MIAMLAVFVIVVVMPAMPVVHMTRFMVMVGVLAMFVVMAMVVVMVTGIEEIGIDVQLGIQVETAQIKHFLDRHFAEMHHLVRRARVHVLEAVLQRGQFVGGDQIGLADENLVGKAPGAGPRPGH